MDDKTRLPIIADCATMDDRPRPMDDLWIDGGWDDEEVAGNCEHQILGWKGNPVVKPSINSRNDESIEISLNQV